VSINTLNNVNMAAYKSGIYTDCVNAVVDHAVTVVGYGYGRDARGLLKNYWIVRNSWGNAWGE
jgi:C1A family cysteine protease